MPGTEVHIMMNLNFMAVTKPAKRKVYLFSIEIKPPTKTTNDDICEDQVKLGNQMKTMMQTLESLNIEIRKHVVCLYKVNIMRHILNIMFTLDINLNNRL